jgi:hypothetical protein
LDLQTVHPALVEPYRCGQVARQLVVDRLLCLPAIHCKVQVLYQLELAAVPCPRYLCAVDTSKLTQVVRCCFEVEHRSVAGLAMLVLLLECQRTYQLDLHQLVGAVERWIFARRVVR